MGEMPAVLELDHLVVAARRLEEGVRWVEERLGVVPEPGGAHAGFGTHNALLRLGSDVYLEVLAPDPAQPAPRHPRLFGLDAPATRALLEGGPQLLHWVVRTRNVGAALARLVREAGVSPAALGAGVPMQRGQLRWTLALPADGARPPQGLPSVIDWGNTPHPCARLPDRGVVLERLSVPTPALALLAELARNDARVHRGPLLAARLRLPSGATVVLG